MIPPSQSAPMNSPSHSGVRRFEAFREQLFSPERSRAEVAEPGT